MKRALTKRGFAMFQTGTVPQAELIKDPKFSVEVTEGMKLTSHPVNVAVKEPEADEAAAKIAADAAAAAAELAAGDPDAVAAAALAATKLEEEAAALAATGATDLKTATDSLNVANTKVIDLTAKVEGGTKRELALQASIDSLQAQLTSARPLMESAVNGISMRLSGVTTDLSGKTGDEVVAMYAQVSTEFTNAFPGGQVSVVSDEGEEGRSDLSTSSVNMGMVEMYHRANRVNVD